MKSIIWAVIAGVILFEIMEHIVFPLVWYVWQRKKSSMAGASAMVGDNVQVMAWQGKEGRVRYHGTMWKARCDTPLVEGQQVRIDGVDGLVLNVAPLGD